MFNSKATRSTRLPATIGDQVDLHAFPELWVPDVIADAFNEISDDLRGSISPATHPAWWSELRGEDRQSIAGMRLKSPLEAHLSVALAHLHYDGIVPGSVAKPTTQRFAEVPLGFGSGTQMKPVERTEGEEKQLELHYWSEEHREEFEALVAAKAGAVLADPSRAWGAYAHIKLIALTYQEIERRTEADRRERQRIQMERCPICARDNGHLKTRPITLEEKAKPSRFDIASPIRSCRPCWVEACNQLQARHSAEHLDDGRTRAEHITDWLDKNLIRSAESV